MPKVVVIEPDITEEEQVKNLDNIIEVLKLIVEQL